MDIKILNKISAHIIHDFRKYRVTTMEGIGLLESIKLSLFNDSIKKVEKNFLNSKYGIISDYINEVEE